MRLSLFCLLLGMYVLVYLNRPDAIDGDATLAVAVSFMQHGTPDIAALGASEGLLPGLSRMGSFGIDGQLYSKKGVTPSLFLLPFVAIAQIAPWLTIRATAMLFNPLVTALTGVVLFSFLLDLKFSARASWLTALLYGVATFALSYTRTLFGEPLAALLLLLGVWQLWRQQYFLAGAAWALCIGINVSYAVMVGIGGIFVLLSVGTVHASTLRSRLSKILLFALPNLVFGGFLLLYNVVRFGNPLTSGYNFAEGEGFNYPVLWGIFGLVFSPYRGIFWYNPLLLLALPGAWLWWKKQPHPQSALYTLERERQILILTMLFIIAQTVIYAAWWSWHGGIVWGARFLIPVLPLMMLFVAPMLVYVLEKRAVFWRIITMSLVLISLLIQFVGSVYDYQHYVGYLYQHYASGRVDGLVSGLTDEVMLNPALSPIVGHVNRLFSGANFDMALTAMGIHGVHLLAVIIILSIAPAVWFYSKKYSANRAYLYGFIAAIVVFVALNIIVAQQQTTPNSLPIEYQTLLQPIDTLVVADANIGNTLLDIEEDTRAISMNAPTRPDDILASGLWRIAKQSGGYLWYITWLPRLHEENWQERDLWTQYAFVREIPFLDKRAVLFDIQPPAEASQEGGWQFGAMQLAQYGILKTATAVRVTFAWQTQDAIPQDFGWFVHLVDANGQIVAQQDRPPQGGYRMTTAWQPSEIIYDYLSFPVAAGTDTTGWRLRIGWLDPHTGERLPLTLPENGAGINEDNALLLALDE